MLLRLLPNDPAGSQLTVINGTLATGYTVTNEIDWGNVVWQHATSGARGTQGARPAIGVPDNRVVSIPVHIGPTGSVDSCNVKAALLCEAVDDLRRFGGQILWQATGQTPRQFFDVMQSGVTKQSWGRKGAIVDTAECVILADCAPYMLGDPMDTRDGFDSDTITAGDWTRNAASSGVLTVSGGQLVPTSTGLKVYRHTLKGYSYTDVEVMVKVRTGATITNGIWGVMARMDTAGADQGCVAEIVAGTNVIRTGTVGTPSSLSTAAFTPAANTTYWIRLRCESYQQTAEVFSSEPTSLSTPLATVTSSFSPPRNVTGHAGIRVTVADTAELYDDFVVRPYTFRGVVTPEPIRISAIPGDVSAMVDLEITPRGGTMGTPIWGLAAWLERPLPTNLCWNGDFEDANVGTSGWNRLAVTGVLAAASTSIARATTAARAKYGTGSLLITCPATTDTGASFQFQRRVRKGRILAALIWASSAAATTQARAKLGVSGDLVTGTAAALTTTPTLFSALWAAAADTDNFYAAFGINAATAGNMNIDAICVVESPYVALAAAISSTSATTLTVYSTPTETPGLSPDGTLATPFLILIDNEIIRVTAINPTTKVWTIDRGQEGTTAATHTLDRTFAILPPLRPQFEGKGAPPAFGLIEGDDSVLGLSDPGAGTFTPTADANARLGDVQRWAPGTSGAQAASLVYFIDPNTLVPDDYTLGELDVEVWLRHAWTPTLTSLRVTASAQPEGGATAGGSRFTREFGNLGRPITPAGAKVNRVTRLGSIPMVVDRSNPLRWRLKIALSCTGGASPAWDLDYLMLVATRARLASPTGEANDTASAAGTFPAFVPYDAAWGASSAMTRTLRSDGTSIVTVPGNYGYPDAGFGDVLEMPDADVDLITKVSNLVPDDLTVTSDDETFWSMTSDIHLSVTPRYVLARSA